MALRTAPGPRGTHLVRCFGWTAGLALALPAGNSAARPANGPELVRASANAPRTGAPQGARGKPAPSGKAGAKSGEQLIAPPWVAFEGTLDEATELARKRNVPLVFLWVYEPEPWNPKEHYDVDDLRKAWFDDPLFDADLQRALVLVGCDREHELEDVPSPGGQRPPGEPPQRRCSSYRTSTCAVHKAAFRAIYTRFNQNEELHSPFVAVALPDGQVIGRIGTGKAFTKDEVRRLLEKAGQKLGPGLSAREFQVALDLVQAARAAEKDDAPGKAWATWGEVLALTQNTEVAEDARLGLERTLAVLEAERDSAAELLTSGKVIDAYEAYTRTLERCAGTPLQADLEKALKAMESDKATRDEIQAHKRAAVVQSLFDEIAALIHEGDDKKAVSKLRTLLKRFGDTPQAEQARKRWPDLTRDL